MWSCPTVAGPDGAWPRWVGAIYAEPGSARPDRIVEVRRGEELLGSGIVRSDGSYLVPLRTYERETFADGVVYIAIEGEETEHRWARIAPAAPIDFFNYGDACRDTTWSIDAELVPRAVTSVEPAERMLGVNMLGAGQNAVPSPPLGERFLFDVSVEACWQPWLALVRHEDGSASGCWDLCPPGETERCGGCTRLAWAAGRCSIGLPVPPPMPDGGPPDAGADAGAMRDAYVDPPE